MSLIDPNRVYRAKFFIDLKGDVRKDVIFKVSRYGNVKFLKKTKGEAVELEDEIVIPAPVNAHTHLELSLIKRENLNFSSFVDWLISLIQEKRSSSNDTLLRAYFEGKKELRDFHTPTFANIISDSIFESIPREDRIYNFVELIGYDRSRLLRGSFQFPKLAPHSFYTVHPEIIERAVKTSKPVSIHFFESKEEYEYLIHGKGDIPEKFYKFVGFSPLRFDENFFSNFLKKLKGVQLVHLSNLPSFLKEMLLSKREDLFFTLCPRSNKTFGFSSPHLFFLKNRIPFSLGTDSLCSNIDLDVFKEAEFIFEDVESFFEKEELLNTLFSALTFEGYRIFKFKCVRFVSLSISEIRRYRFLEEFILTKCRL